EALTCFWQGAFNAFASMCRRTAQAMFADLGEAGRLRLFDEFNAVRELADIAPEVFAKLKSVLFGAELDARSALPLLDGYEARSEALTCFWQGAFNAFASMCRRTAQAMFADLGEAGRLRLFDEFNAVRELADIAPEVFAKLKSVLFGAELDARSALPLLDGYEA